ncbi:MAG: ABC transporter substrate-binding protein [Chloroflexi bacterium]|nr:ABC transporter substrate-binding protein [Chloroflexota bacterium]
MKKYSLIHIFFMVCLSILVFILPIISGCKKEISNDEITPHEKVTFKMGWTFFPRTQNPFLGLSGRTDQTALQYVYEPLLYMNYRDGTFIPLLAKSWQYEAALTTWTFHLDEKAKFSNGSQVTADDVKYSFETAWNVANQYSDSKALTDSISVVDSTTVKFKLKAPFAYYLELIAACQIVPKAIWSQVGDVLKYDNKNPVGSGPFLWTDLVANESLVFKKNPNYWLSTVNIDEIIVQFYGSQDNVVLALQKGDIDTMSELTLTAAVPGLIRDPDIKVDIYGLSGSDQLLLNLRKEPFNLLEVRKAMDIAIDRKAIIYQAKTGFASMPMLIPQPPCPWVSSDLKWPYEFTTATERIAMANAKLDAVPNMSTIGSDGLRSYKGKKLIFDQFLWNSQTPSVAVEAQVIVDGLKAIGIQFNSKPQNYTTAFATVMRNGGKSTLAWDAFITQGIRSSPTFSAFQYNWANPEPAPLDQGGVWNPTLLTQSEAAGWTNKTIQDKFAQVVKELDDVKRTQLEVEISKQWAAECPEIITFYSVTIMPYRINKFSGWMKDYSGITGNGFLASTNSVIQIMKLQVFT